jgi:putative PEP-CTERM system histidine kinase
LYALSFTSHATAAVAFALLLIAAIRWRDRLRGSLLLLALLATSAWAAITAAESSVFVSTGLLLANVCKSLAWVVFITRVLTATRSRLAPALRFAPLVAVVLVAVLAAWATGAVGGVPDAESIARTLVVSGLALSILGFVLVEQAIRNTREGQVWAVKLLWLATGALFAYDVALYSTSYVLGAIEPTLWDARGFATACVAPLLYLGLRRVRELRPQRLMSHQFAFYTGSVIVAGGYLVLVALAGYYVRVLGGTWGAALEVTTIFAALVGFAIVVFSATARARLRVELAKHLFPYKYDYRTEWLDLTARLTGHDGESSLGVRIVDAFGHMARSRGGGIWIARDDVLVPEAGNLVSGDLPAEPRSGAFCRFLAENEWIVDLDAARARTGRDADVPVPPWLLSMQEAWLAIPLLHDGKLVALVVTGRPLAASELTWEDLDLLKTAGRQAASYLALEQAAEALARERQFAAFSRFSAFMMHDLSNILAQQQLIVENAARHKHNPAFIDDAVDTIQNTVRRMTRLLEQMKSGAAESATRRSVLVDVAERATRNLSDRQPAPELVVQDSAVAAMVAADRLEHVLEHVIRNAQDATPHDGSVRVVVRAEDDAGVIEVVDTGRGMDSDFVRERLFRPFDTTKGAKGMGIGAFQTREFVRAAGGDVRVSSTPGSGTAFVIRLPRA